ncbi:MAG: type IV pilus assembly protein PilM [Armatimonadetes bacterium]|nr:type IV pilus assembly protein PilM [Armatimonadota bacterium]
MLGSLFGKETVVGIDIGSSCIKAVQIEPTAHGWELVNAAVMPTRPEAIKEGVIFNVADVAADIKTMLKNAGIKANGAICAISGPQVIVRQVQFPKMSEAILRKSVKYEASKHISSSMEDSVVEFQILGDVPDSNMMNVMLVAAPRDVVFSRVSALEAAGLEPLVVDVEAFSIIRSFIEFNATDEYLDSTVALIDMGASHTDVNIVSCGEFALTRNIPIAGNSFTNAVKSLTGSLFEEAEIMKLQMTANQSLDEIDIEDPNSRCWRVVQPLLDELIREIRRSVNYYQSQFPEGSSDSHVSKVILTGGSARMRGIDTYMSNKLTIKVEIADIFKQSAINVERIPKEFLSEHGPILAVGTGLALKELMVESKRKVA